VRKGEGVTERLENRGSEGGVLGPHHGLWGVVVGIHRRSWWWALNLPSAFLSRHDVAVDGRDVESTSCQLPVGSRRWWCWVSGVGGNRHGEVAYHIHTKRRCCRRHCPSSVCIAWLPRRSATWPGSLVGWFVALGPWGAVFVSSLCVVVVVIRWSWPLLGGRGRLLGSCRRLWWQSFVGPWQSFVAQLSSFGGRGCLQWWGLRDMAWGRCVEVVVVGS